MFSVRFYKPKDYEEVIALYKQSDTFGGQFDPDRDSKERLAALTTDNPESILIAEQGGKIVGTLSFSEDKRTAWFFRFAVEHTPEEDQIIDALYRKGCEILKRHGHKQVLVYSPVNHSKLDGRYKRLGFTKGNDYTCYWTEM